MAPTQTDSPRIDEARRSLAEHVADRARTDADVALARRRWHPVTALVGILATFMLVTAAIQTNDARTTAATPESLLFLWGIFVVLATVFAFRALPELRADQRTHPRSPQDVARSFFRAFGSRPGYVVAALCPTARDEPVRAPAIGDGAAGDATFRLSSTENVERYAKTFLSVDGSHIRSMKVVAVRPQSVEPDLSRVEVDLVFASRPTWPGGIMSFALFARMRMPGTWVATVALVAVVGAIIAWFALASRKKATTTKTLLRGEDDRWYVLEPGVAPYATRKRRRAAS